MSASAPDIDKLRALDDGTRRAWTTYRGGLAELTGEEYERAEAESWEKLQRELGRIDRRRQSLHGTV